MAVFSSFNIVSIFFMSIIMLCLMSAVYMAFWIKSQYRKQIADLKEENNRRFKTFDCPVNNHIVKDYIRRMEAENDNVDTIEIIQNNQAIYTIKTQKREAIIFPLSISVIFIGILGWIFSLFWSISHLVSQISSMGSEIVGDVDNITGGLLSSISGMSLAYMPFVFGLIAFVMIQMTVLILGLKEVKKEYLAVLNNYLCNELGEKL